ncbi:MAG: hypothetical protein MUF54_19200, partial [Polyangiaceae bacterium]|nr:hypothetical protein [Polyangiaceae bacterium]
MLCPVATHAEEPIHEGVVQATTTARTARGAATYAALRELWGLWDQTDPIHVEQAIRAVAQTTTLDAPGRAYAGLLGAYARRRRGDLLGAQAQIAALGFVRDWLVVGPFDNEGRAGLANADGPEADLREPLDMQRAYEGKERPVRWRAAPDVFPYGWLALGDMVRPREKTCTYATTFVRARDNARQASVWVGTTGAFRLFWNGEEVLSDEHYRQLDADR